MTWLLWRQHRLQMLLIGIALALFAVAVVVTGHDMANVYNAARSTCSANGTCALVVNFFSGYGAMLAAVQLTIAVPVLFGAFGAALISRETETATNVLVWTQSVTRRRWVVAKVLTALGIALVTSAAVSALVTWWSSTPNALNANRFGGSQFDTQNLAPIAFALFAVALGLAAGCILRRPLPAIAATVGIYAVVRVLVSVYARPHWMTPITRSVPLGQDGNLPSGSWTISQTLVDRGGHAVNGPGPALPSSCGAVIDKRTAGNCLSRLGYHFVVKYQPASRYWHFQLAESALFLVLAAVLVGVAVVYTLRHDA